MAKETNATELMVPTREMGGALIEAAREQRRKQITDKCVGIVNNLIGQVEHTKEKIKKSEEDLAFYERRLSAIQNGEITFDHGGIIVYDDKELNKARETS